jgi:hypothetical protein
LIQFDALVLVAVLMAVAVGWMRIRALTARGGVVGQPAGRAHEAYILYFSGDGCTICRTHQEPALRTLEGVQVQKVDALAEPELARRYRVYTLPTTVVVDSDGRVRHVNYGFASAERLRRQIESE